MSSARFAYWLLMAWFNRPAVQQRAPIRPTAAGLVLFTWITCAVVLVILWALAALATG